MDGDWYYILDDRGQPAPAASVEEWGAWYARNMDARRVDRTELPSGVEVSTVFLALNHRHFGSGPPILYETMVFGGEHDQMQWRWVTREQAIAGHDQIVAALRAGASPAEVE